MNRLTTFLGPALVLAAGLAVSACKNTPTNNFGMPWWPNQPGVVPPGVNEDDKSEAKRVESTQTAGQKENAEAPVEQQETAARSTVQSAPPVTTPSPSAGRPDSVVIAANRQESVPLKIDVQSAMATPMPVLAPTANRYTQMARYGDLVFVSGQIALDLNTNNFVEGSVAQQTTQILNNVQVLLATEGLSLANIVSTTVYLKSIAALPEFDKAYYPFFKGRMPARSVVEVSDLPRGAQVEISAVAGR